LIETISEETLTARYETAPPPPAEPHASVDGEIRVGAALTNLNGLPYGYPVTPGGRFTYIDYADQRTRHVMGPQSDTRDFWEPLRQAAVASGAFPFAFRPKAIERSKAADPDDYNSPNLEWPGNPTTFTYSDGGILQNQPLGMAKNLVDEIDSHLEEKRFFLFVSPHAKDPTTAAIVPGSLNIFEELKRIVALIMGQSGFQDWITAEGVNERVRLLDQRAKGLAEAIEKNEIDVRSLSITAGSILNLFFPNGSHLPPGSNTPETLQAARDRIAKQYADPELKDLAAIPGASDAFRDAVLAFESAAQLGARDVMTIYGVTANNNELAGAGLESFLGFFDQQFRDHDYDIGRTHAQAFLMDDIINQPNQLGPLRFVPEPIRPIDTSLNELRLDEVSSDDVRPFRNGLRNRVNQMLHELHWQLADPIADIVVDRVIDHVMPGAKSAVQGSLD
jgi:hypothetical protein